MGERKINTERKRKKRKEQTCLFRKTVGKKAIIIF